MNVYAALLTAAVCGSSPSVTLDLPVFRLAACSVNETVEGTMPFMPGAYPGWTAGLPAIPAIPWSVAIPEGCIASRVESDAVWETISSSAFIPPLPAPVPLSVTETGPVELDGTAYASVEWWPASPVVLSGTGFHSGIPEAGLLVTPFRWNPSSGELQRLASLTVHLATERSGRDPLPTLDTGNLRMLIVTDASLEAIFQQLADRRTDQGIRTEVVTMEQVLASAPGRDDAEQLRNFVKSYRESNGLDYLLLGGDTNLVPLRYAYAMTCEAGIHPREDSLPCDLYFSDLDGSWDANGNLVFGEVDDEVDLFPDVFVGRAPVENPTEAQAFVDKTAAYEDASSGSSDHYDAALFLAMILWEDPYTDSGESKNYIMEEFVPGGIDVTRLYQSLGNENLGTVMLAMIGGQNFVNHDGHAWWSSLGLGDDYMTAEHIDAIDSNGRFSSFMYSIGCWSAAFDFDAVGEHYVTNPDGCGAGYIGNSSYGWGSPGNPCYGYSDALDHQFFRLLFEDPSLTSGQLLAETKVYFIPFSRWENVYRWHQYDVNLLGDPSLLPYRTTPVDPEISCPSLITRNTGFFPVLVSGVPTEGLTVCIRDQGSIWMVSELDATGMCEFVLPGQVQGGMKVTVTGPGVRRTSITVEPSAGPDAVVSGLLIADDAGLGHLSPGCQAGLVFSLLNQGTAPLSDVGITVDSLTGPATLLQGSSAFGDLVPGNETQGAPPITLYVESSAASGEVVDLHGRILTAQGTWNLEMPLMIHAPGLYFSTCSVNDSISGNGNGYPEPGETFDLQVNLANSGFQVAEGVWVVMTGQPDWVSWVSDSARVDSVPAGGTAPLLFSCRLAAEAPSPSFPWILFQAGAETTGYTTCDSLRLTVGETGISNDVESGDAGWTHAGSGDLWSITDVSSHSPTHSWRCGTSSGYEPGMDCSLVSPDMVLAPQASISFWASFDVAIYGSDGLYVIVTDLASSQADTLDFIGSGGALGLGSRGGGTGWCRWCYDLSAYETGTQVRLELRFVSDTDGERGTGFLVDDIIVQGAYTGGTGTPGGSSGTLPLLGSPRPNPTSGIVTLPLCLESSGLWSLCVYDLPGRLVLSAEGDAPYEGLLRFDLSGLAPGVYLVRLISPSGFATARLALLGT